MKSPYISTVIVGRNDGYGVNFLERMNLFIRHLDRQVSNHRDLMELIIVEYNPQSDRARFKEILYKPEHLVTRIITVNSETHETTGRTLPVLEWYGKNAGIRRAQGEYVLVTNPDIIFSDALILSLSEKPLRKDVLYRTDRYDYSGDGIQDVHLQDVVKFAMSRTFQVHRCPESLSTGPATEFRDLVKTDTNTNQIFTNASGDFILTARENFMISQGICFETDTLRFHIDSFSLFRLIYKNQLKQSIYTAPCCIFHMDHPRRPIQDPWNPVRALAAVNDPTMFQDHWGFGNFILDEEIL